MIDRSVRLSWVLIYLGWAVAVGIWLVGWLADSIHVGQLAIIFAAVAATLSVREFFIEHDRAVKNIITVLRLGDPGPDDRTRLRSMR